jgi:adenine deaminase
METSGADLPAADLAALLAEGVVYGLAEMMNYPGVVAGDPEVLAKLTAFATRPRDGHAPGLTGHALNAYVAAGIGSDHECTTVVEAAEKLARGLYVLVREATNARNLRTLLPLIDRYNARRICLCSDDRIPGDLLDCGSIDYMIREAIAYGIDPIDAVRMATLNPAEWFGLHGRGALAPGYRADLVVFDSFADFRPRQVYAGGKLVASDGRLASDLALTPLPWPGATVLRIDWDAVNLGLPARSNNVRVIGAIPDQIVTEARVEPARIEAGCAVADPARDLLKIAVVERHHGSGAHAVGFIHGFGLRHGAMAGTVAHDHHNLIVIGADDRSLLTAAHAVADLGGGLAVARGEQVIAQLPLPVAGLMSDRSMPEVRSAYDRLVAAAGELGSPLHDPFMAMSFMALAVIPKLKLTDRGLVDIEHFAFVDLFV